MLASFWLVLPLSRELLLDLVRRGLMLIVPWLKVRPELRTLSLPLKRSARPKEPVFEVENFLLVWSF